MQEDKRRLRREIARRVAALSPAERRRRSDAVAARVLALPEFGRARGVMLFAAMPDEVDTMPIVAGALAAGKRVALPRCLAESPDLEVVEVGDPGADLAPGRFGILEPVGDSVIPPAALDFVLVPGRAFDRQGNRLGRGAAYYDRFLAGPAAGAVRCAVCFDCQVIERVPHQAHDVPVQVIVTESGVVRPVI